MNNREKVETCWRELKKLWADRDLMSYQDMGEKIETHHRHVRRYLGVIQAAIEVYNLRNNTEIPHINALVVNKRTRTPGVGCISQPHTVHAFDYEPVFSKIENILLFISSEKFESYFRTLEWDELIPALLKILPGHC